MQLQYDPLLRQFAAEHTEMCSKSLRHCAEHWYHSVDRELNDVARILMEQGWLTMRAADS